MYCGTVLERPKPVCCLLCCTLSVRREGGQNMSAGSLFLFSKDGRELHKLLDCLFQEEREEERVETVAFFLAAFFIF